MKRNNDKIYSSLSPKFIFSEQSAPQIFESLMSLCLTQVRVRYFILHTARTDVVSVICKHGDFARKIFVGEAMNVIVHFILYIRYYQLQFIFQCFLCLTPYTSQASYK
jgi:hypothetical protein